MSRVGFTTSVDATSRVEVLAQLSMRASLVDTRQVGGLGEVGVYVLRLRGVQTRGRLQELPMLMVKLIAAAHILNRVVRRRDRVRGRGERVLTAQVLRVQRVALLEFVEGHRRQVMLLRVYCEHAAHWHLISSRCCCRAATRLVYRCCCCCYLGIGR